MPGRAIDQPQIIGNHVRIPFARHRQERGQPAALVSVVSIEHGDPLASSLIERQVTSRPRSAATGRADKFDPRLRESQLGDEVRRAVARRVVDHQNLQCDVVLRKSGFNRFADQIHRIERGDNDRYINLRLDIRHGRHHSLGYSIRCPTDDPPMRFHKLVETEGASLRYESVRQDATATRFECAGS